MGRRDGVPTLAKKAFAPTGEVAPTTTAATKQTAPAIQAVRCFGLFEGGIAA